jgi:hypothetical protein
MTSAFGSAERRGMTIHRLLIDRFRTRLDLAGRDEDGPPLAREVGRTVRDLLPPLCARALEPRLGARPGVVRIDRLRLALGISRDGLSATALAERLAEQLARGIADALAGQGGAAPRIALWSDHASFAAAYVAHRLGLLAAPDWAFPDFRPLAHLAPAEAAVEVLAARPAILAQLTGLLAGRGGAARLAAALPEAAAADLVTRLGAAAPPSKPSEETEVLAALIGALPQDPAASPGRATLTAAMAYLGARPEDGVAVPALLALARVAVALAAAARAVRLDRGRAVEAEDLAPAALLHLPESVRGLVHVGLGPIAGDAAARSALIEGLRAATSGALSPRRDGRPAASAAAGSESTAAVRVLNSRIAGLGLLLPAALRHGLPEALSPAALHRVLVAGLAEEDRPAARLDPLPAALAPFDPRDGEPVFPPVPDSLRGAVPEPFRPALAKVEGAPGWAGCLLHAFAAMLPGFEASSPGYLRGQFLARHGRLVVAPDRMTLLLAPLPLGILLRHAGLHGWTGRLPQAGNAVLSIEIEDG